MAITTQAKVKTILGLDTTYNTLIDSLIPMIEADYLRIRNKDFDVDVNNNTIYPVGAELTAIQMISYQIQKGSHKSAIISENFGDYSVSYSQSESEGYPSSLTSKIKRYVSFV